MTSWFTRNRTWILAASIGINLFFVGLVGSTLIFGAFRGPGGPPSVRWMMKTADAEARPIIDSATAARRDELETARAAYRASKAQVKTAFTAETVDVEALRRALQANTDARVVLSNATAEIFIDVAPQLSLETRQKIAKRTRRRNVKQ